jgi:hypothetical protein
MSSCASRADWEQVAAPVLPEQTADVPFDGPLPDGRYWGEVTVIHGRDTVAFVLAKARFGEFCHAWAAAQALGEECLNDYYVEESPSVVVALTGDVTVSLAEITDPSVSYQVRPATLEALLEGASGLHPGYEWTPFPFLLRIESGELVSADQVWVP